MSTRIGTREGQFPYSLTYTGVSVADPAGDDQVITVPTGSEGYIDINKCLALVTTTVVSTATPGVVNIKKNATIIGTMTMTDALAKNSVAKFVPATGFEVGVNVAAADTITIASTLGVGGTVAGIASVTLALYQS